MIDPARLTGGNSISIGVRVSEDGEFSTVWQGMQCALNHHACTYKIYIVQKYMCSPGIR